MKSYQEKKEVLPTGFLATKISWLKRVLLRMKGNRFFKNASWLAGAELANRITRLITAVILARYLSPVEFGIAAVALTCNELIKVLAQNGVGAKIIQASEEQLSQICNTAYRLNWIFFIGLTILQCSVALIVADYYQNPELGYMISYLAIVYLIMPFGLVQAFLIQRNNKLRVTAIVSASQITADNLLTAVLALFGFGIWSIIIPKVLVAPIWLFGTLSQQQWSRQLGATMKGAAEILQFGKNILGSELAKVLRANIDNILVAWVLGLEAAGIYYFAKNAGLGISLSLISAFNLSLFTHLCEFSSNLHQLRREFLSSIRTTSLVLIPIIATQAILAYWYVPLLFGEQWNIAIVPISLLCLSAIPRPMGEAASELLKSLGRADVDFCWNILFSIGYLLAVSIGVQWGVVGVAGAILCIHLLMPAYCIWTITQFIPKQNKSLKQLNFLGDK
ncbi:MAG: lipopolysaccharide biosynthesis protein [Kangiellaceae bacterium]